MNYLDLSPELTARIEADRKGGTLPDFGCKDEDAIRTFADRDRSTLLRPAFSRDIDKILHCPFYNRYADKTQVFTFYKNDDISRRALHVQLVSRIARNLGRILNLNLDLIEAIALGHDIGHTPFGHAGERILDELLQEHCSLRFAHNVQSVRVLNEIFPYNITLQTLDGILCHNGENEQCKYEPTDVLSTRKLELSMVKCSTDIEHNRQLMPATLEGCLVRVCDMIAYLGKDRQDARRAKLVRDEAEFGEVNAQLIRNLMVGIIENSYGKRYIMLDPDSFAYLAEAKKKNYEQIYGAPLTKKINDTIRPMMAQLYDKLLADVKAGDRSSLIWRHHIEPIVSSHYEHNRTAPYEEQSAHLIVADYLASMTDDYLVDLYAHLFPSSTIRPEYVGYFDK